MLICRYFWGVDGLTIFFENLENKSLISPKIQHMPQRQDPSHKILNINVLKSGGLLPLPEYLYAYLLKMAKFPPTY